MPAASRTTRISGFTFTAPPWMRRTYCGKRKMPCPSEPCPQYIPENPAKAVLEIAAGGAARHGLEAGDLLEFERVEGYPLQPAPVGEEN